MRISTKGRYGLRAMVELARGFGETPVRMSTIADRQRLSRKHLHALLAILKSGGLVRSVRGPEGGFLLARSPDQISLGEVLEALEGPFSLVDCVADRRTCDRVNECVTRGVWQELSGAIENLLDDVTLQDLVVPEPSGRSKTKRKRKVPGSRRNTRGTVEPAGAASRRPRVKAGNR